MNLLFHKNLNARILNDTAIAWRTILRLGNQSVKNKTNKNKHLQLLGIPKYATNKKINAEQIGANIEVEVIYEVLESIGTKEKIVF